jgi:hypothetical protein
MKGVFQAGKFQLKKSEALLDLERDEDRHIGQGIERGYWESYITVTEESAAKPLGVLCDVQVNYQMSLSAIDSDNIDLVELWESIWVTQMNPDLLGPDTFSLEFPPSKELHPAGRDSIYRNQTYAAMWRLAKHLSKMLFQHVEKFSDVAPLTQSLIAYLIVVGAITIPSGQTKNAMLQLPKTSPASIAKLIVEMNPRVADYFHTDLVEDNPTNSAVTLPRNPL